MSSGDISLIQDQKLRIALASWESDVENLVEVEDMV